MDKQAAHIEDLVAKFQSGTISPDEMRELQAWYINQPDDQVRIVTTDPVDASEVRQRMLDNLMSKVRLENSIPRKIPYWQRPRFWAVASVAAVLLILALVWTKVPYVDRTVDKVASGPIQKTIVPGGNKAILLIGGKRLELDTNQSRIVIGQSIEYADGRPLAKEIKLDAEQDLQLYVPKGGIYQVTLSDGTQVWLNSDSRLTYPSKFASTARTVELDGEAFFAVKSLYDQEKKRIPFFIKSKGQTVEVVGTKFNVNGYASQSFVKTTLLEGKVNIHVQGHKIALVPGQQASTVGSRTRVSEVQPQRYISWTEGKFCFDGKSFAETMDEIGRWYDLRIIYKSEVPRVELVGDAFRNEKINLVLRLLDAADVRYRLDIEKRQLVVY